MNQLIRLSTAVAITLFACQSITAALAHEMKLGSLKIFHPWSSVSAEDPRSGGGYMKITNTGKTDDRLIKATCEIASDVQLVEMVNGEARVQNSSGGIVIPAGKTIVLGPKASHVMLMRIKSKTMSGMIFKGSLTFERAGTINIEYEVE